MLHERWFGNDKCDVLLYLFVEWVERPPRGTNVADWAICMKVEKHGSRKGTKRHGTHAVHLREKLRAHTGRGTFLYDEPRLHNSRVQETGVR